MFIIIFIIFLFGCTSKSISHQNAKSLIDNDKNIIIIDVRNKDEYNQERIKNAILLPNEEIEEKALDVISDKEKTYLVYCQTGKRSSEAVEILNKLGYKNVFVLGGLDDWPYEKES